MPNSPSCDKRRMIFLLLFGWLFFALLLFPIGYSDRGPLALFIPFILILDKYPHCQL